MGESYVAQGLAERPTFELFAAPARAGLPRAGSTTRCRARRAALHGGDLAFLEGTGLFGRVPRPARGLRFSGDVRALPEETAFFPREPVLEVTAPLLEAQLVETLLLNRVHAAQLAEGGALGRRRRGGGSSISAPPRPRLRGRADVARSSCSPASTRRATCSPRDPARGDDGALVRREFPDEAAAFAASRPVLDETTPVDTSTPSRRATGGAGRAGLAHAAAGSAACASTRATCSS